MTPAETLAHFEGRTQSIVEAIREIVEIDSPSQEAERSLAVADWAEAQFRSTDVEIAVEHIFAEGDGDHLVLRAFPGEAKAVMLVGHTDTVHPVGTREKN